nr:hypothetical protein [Marinobacter sp. DS40M6]
MIRGNTEHIWPHLITGNGTIGCALQFDAMFGRDPLPVVQCRRRNATDFSNFALSFYVWVGFEFFEDRVQVHRPGLTLLNLIKSSLTPLLCIDKVRIYFCAMDKHEDFLNRLNEAIKDGDAKQVRIAEYCDVSEQAVARWKRSGQISKDNLFALSEISGYRYLWIKSGEGGKRISSVTENRNEYMKSENTKVYYARDTEDSDDIEQLVEAIRKAHANKVLTDQAISHLTSFIRTLNNRR